jgi:hypothetical protein
MYGSYQLRRADNQFMFNLKVGNHETILASEPYSSKQAAEGGIASCRTNGPSAPTKDET